MAKAKQMMGSGTLELVNKGVNAVLSVGEVSVGLDQSERSVWRLIKAGEIPVVVFGESTDKHGRKRRNRVGITVTALNDYIARHESKTVDPAKVESEVAEILNQLQSRT